MIEYKVIVYKDRIEWRNLQGQIHREDGPAVEWSDGSKSWWLNNFLHRENGPAVEWLDGTKKWYLDGKEYSEKEYWEEVKSSQSSCDGKIVEIEGKKYKLQLQET